MRINTNLAALNANRNLSNTQMAVDQSMARLSSGFRINRAADDAAGLGIANKLRADVRSLNQASKNAEQGNSVVSIAEGATNSIQTMLERMKELATEAGSDTTDSAGRTRIVSEYNQLSNEIDRVVNTTVFQGQTLLKAGTVTAGAGTNASITSNYTNVSVAGSPKVASMTTTGSLTASSTFTLTDNGDGTITLSDGASTSIKAAIQADRSVKFVDDGTLGGNVTLQLGSDYDSSTAGRRLTGQTFTTNAGHVVSNATLLAATTTVTKNAVSAVDLTGNTLNTGWYTLKDDGSGNVSLLYSSAGGVTGGQVFDSNGNAIVGKIANGQLTVGGVKITLGADYNSSNPVLRFDGTTNSKFNITTTSAGTTGAKDFLIGSSGNYTTGNSGDYITLAAMNLSTGAAGLNLGAVDLSTASGARSSLSIIDTAIGTVSSRLGDIGAFQNRIESAMNNLKSSIQNYTAAESVIRDVDMADEMTKFSKNQILAQAGTAMLAQANQLGQGVLQLLRG